MAAAIDLIGHTFGRLRVTELLGVRNRSPLASRGHRYWRCECECGNQIETCSTNLRTGNTKSCGCLQRERVGKNSHLYSGGLLQAEYRRQISGARRRSLEFNLSVSELEILFTSNCFYCKSAPKEDNRGLVRNGVDRMDNAEGYTVDNCVACCKVCNRLKGAMSADCFIEHISKILKNLTGN